MPELYLAQAIQNIAARQMMEKAKADDEARDIRMAKNMADIQFENQKRINQLAIEETKKAKQEELGRETAFNASMGFNIQKHAHLLSADPKERERLKGIGQVMQATGMSPDAVLSYMKVAKGGDEFAAEKLELAKERFELQKTMFEFKKQLQGEKAPPEVMEAQKSYHRAVSDMNKALAKGEMEPQDITAEYMEAINSNAATIESWREGAGLAPLGLATIEAEEVPASFLSRVFGKKTKTELKLKGKKTKSTGLEAIPTEKPKEAPKPTTKKDIKTRAIEIKNEHADWSVEQIQKQLETEGYKRKAK